jgi:hypothetical protein
MFHARPDVAELAVIDRHYVDVRRDRVIDA